MEARIIAIRRRRGAAGVRAGHRHRPAECRGGHEARAGLERGLRHRGSEARSVLHRSAAIEVSCGPRRKAGPAETADEARVKSVALHYVYCSIMGA